MFAALLLLVVVVAYRIVSGFVGADNFAWLHNFAPLGAVALCGAVYLPRRMAAILPLLMLFISDAVLNVCLYPKEPLFTLEILPRYLALALISLLGFALRGRANLGRLLLASVAGSIVFYVVTNTGSWLSNPAYAKTAAGWVQALTTGLPGYAPTWMFYRSTLLSDILFTLVFAACMAVPAKAEPDLAPAGSRQASGI
jgi:hypothetical protein